MNEDILKGMWLQLRGKIKDKWSKLTEDDLDYIDGSKDRLLEKLQEVYEFGVKKARSEWNKFYELIVNTTEEIEDEAYESANFVEAKINNFVKHSPITALGIAALAGLIVGLRF